jgi:hypothetical protein
MASAKTVGFWEGVSLILALIGWGIQTRFPDQKWVGTLVLVTAGVMAFGFLVWWIAQHFAVKEYKRQHQESLPPTQATQNAQINPQFHISPIFAPNFSQSQEQSQSQTEDQAVATKDAVQSEIECTDCYFDKAHLSGSNRLNSYGDGVPIGDGGGSCNIAQAKFYLKPISGSAPSMKLRTRLIFYDATGSQPLRRVSDGVWRETVNFRDISLSTGDTRTLVVAVEAPNVGFGTYEYAERRIGRRRFNQEGIFTHILSPKIETLNGDDLTVQVFLTGKSGGDVILNHKFWFKLSRPELKITQISSPRGIETDMKIQY